MSGFVKSFRFVAAVASGLILSVPAQAQTQTNLQQIADDAALAAVQVLAAGGGTADAIAMAQQSIATVPGTAAQVSASPSDLVVTVKLSSADAKTAASTARYLPPDQPATMSWASRQRFAVKNSPVVVGSSCWRDCEPERLR
jgi:Flp pilus assembly protein TadG